MPNPKNRSELISLIHIHKSSLQSCKDALSYGITDEAININVNGTELDVVCDHSTREGGWTRILDRNVIEQQKIMIIPIDDLQLSYTEMLFKAKSNYYLNYVITSIHHYDYDGYGFCINMLKFGDVWYSSEELSGDSVIDGYKVGLADSGNFSIATDIEIITPSINCWFNQTNIPTMCAKEFILKNLPEGRLNSISDLESIVQGAYSNNKWDQYFEIYVR